MFDEFQEVDRSSLRYVIYLRKSTEDENKQAHSFSDQEKDCRRYAAQLGIEDNIIEPAIKESASAKYPDNRPKFNKLIEDLKAGRIDGIIAYHPDRLSRNMLEAGIVLDMLTPGRPTKKGVKPEPIIKDLLFSSFYFRNDINGRCMLAFQFMMATQYSEHLEEVVTRGVRSHLAVGQSSGTPKWGYRRGDDGFYVPDNNFSHIQHAWEMIRNGSSQVAAVEYLVENDVHYMTKRTPSKISKRVDFTGDGGGGTMSRMLRNPFYYGILCQGGNEVDLRKVQPGFTPVVSQEHWNEVQEALRKNGKKHRGHRKRVGAPVFLPFRGMVECGVCGGNMIAYRTRGKDKAKHALVYYACQNKNCTRSKKQVRGENVVKDLCEQLVGIEVLPEAYDEYSESVESHITKEIDKLNTKKLSLRGSLSKLKSRLKRENTSLKVLKSDSQIPQTTISAAIEEVKSLEQQITATEKELADVVAKIKDPAKVVATKEEFFKFLETADLQMRNGNFVEKDIVARALFSKLVIDNENKTTALYKTEFDGLISMGNSHHLVNGEPGGARTLDTGLKRPVL